MLAVGSVACGSILGDFPDGQLSTDGGTGTDGAAGLDAGGDVMVPENAPDGSICFIPGALVLDMAVDDTDVFWLHAPMSGGQGFAVEACPKTGGAVRRISMLQNQPEAFAISEQYVFWTINQPAGDAGPGGTWRADKRFVSQATSSWLPIDHAGPITFANGEVYTGTYTGSIYQSSPDVASTSDVLTGLGNLESIVVSPSSSPSAFWSNRTVTTVSTAPMPLRGQSVYNTPFVNDLPAPPTSIEYDGNHVYWAVAGDSNSTNIEDHVDPLCFLCPVATIINQPMGFAAYAVGGGNLYWIANENGSGVLRGCGDFATTACTGRNEGKEPLWHASVQVSHIALDAANVYFAAQTAAGSYIVKQPQ